MLKLLSVDRIYADGYHNAFTDLIRWQDHYSQHEREPLPPRPPTPADIFLARLEVTGS